MSGKCGTKKFDVKKCDESKSNDHLKLSETPLCLDRMPSPNVSGR
jgi:hypothetical protein